MPRLKSNVYPASPLEQRTLLFEIRFSSVPVCGADSRWLEGGLERKDSLIRCWGLRSEEDGWTFVDLEIPPVSLIVAEADAAIVSRERRERDAKRVT